MSNCIHETAIISDYARIGHGNYIGPNCVIGPHVTIGNYNRLEGFASIGTAAEHHDAFRQPPGFVSIGNSNIIREFVTINSGTTEHTEVGNNCVLLKGAHVGHDSVLEDQVTLSCGVLVGGHSRVMVRANCGLGSMMHQFSVIGAYAMLGMGAVVTAGLSVTPGTIFVGNPAKFLKPNFVGLDRWRITLEQLSQTSEYARFLDYEAKR